MARTPFWIFSIWCQWTPATIAGVWLLWRVSFFTPRLASSSLGFLVARVLTLALRALDCWCNLTPQAAPTSARPNSYHAPQVLSAWQTYLTGGTSEARPDLSNDGGAEHTPSMKRPACQYWCPEQTSAIRRRESSFFNLSPLPILAKRQSLKPHIAFLSLGFHFTGADTQGEPAWRDDREAIKMAVVFLTANQRWSLS